MPSRLQSLRAELWHLRSGGVKQWRTHRSRKRAHGGQVTVARPSADRQEPRSLRGRPVRAWQMPDRQPRRSLRVGVILDRFSADALRWEWDQVELTADRWRSQVADPCIDLLFVESAWAGSGGSWSYGLTGSKAPVEGLRELVAWCRGHGIPTVFWNKEDPVHFEDFVDTASLFDHVLTSDAAMLGEYAARLGHERVSVMPFAAASWIHNPMRPGGRAERDVAFAGMYFAHKYPERRAQMEVLLGAAAQVSPRMATGLEIFSRFAGGDANYQFPAPLDDYVVGSLDYEQVLTAYREFKVFLNVNSVPDSTTMCPRRVFEIAACATPLVSTPTPAIRAVFPEEEMVTVESTEEAGWLLRALVGNDEWRDRMSHLAARRVLSGHTYRHRVDDFLPFVGLGAHRVTDPSVSAIVSTNRPGQVEHVLRTVAAQQGVDLQLVLLTHGFELDPALRALAGQLGLVDPVFLTGDPEDSLGTCLNRAIEAADGDVVAKMDDDDLYGPHYLGDQLRALDYSGADLVGKHAHHVLLADSGALAVRFGFYEHRFTHFVMGPTLMMPRTTALDLGFADRTQGEDTDLLRRLTEAGGRVYAGDRFGFVQVRRADGHTWTASGAEILANARVVSFGGPATVGHALF